MGNRYLLDTHTFIWWIIDSPRLGEGARATIQKPENMILLNAASTWEISIKTRNGKLELPKTADDFVRNEMAKNAIIQLPISITHTMKAGSLPLHHKDPFDRMLVAQAFIEKLPIHTKDDLIEQYGVRTIWK